RESPQLRERSGVVIVGYNKGKPCQFPGNHRPPSPSYSPASLHPRCIIFGYAKEHRLGFPQNFPRKRGNAAEKNLPRHNPPSQHYALFPCRGVVGS
ncbi:MAG: hypothetical protein K2K98_07515, partial [Muribaculaceae bacterium]|nr:hypothetical protein [Muribaculaceae bacterium]